MIKSSIVESVEKSFRDQDFFDAFKKLENLGYKDFISFLLNREWHCKYNSQFVFWQKYISVSKYFNEFFSSDSCQDFLRVYFLNVKNCNTALIKKLLKEFPDELLKGIRVNKAFLCPEHMETFSAMQQHVSEKIRHHYTFMQFLNEQEKVLFPVFSQIDKHDIFEWFTFIGLWLEKERAVLWQLYPEGGASHKEIQYSVDGISSFLTKYFKEEVRHNEKILNEDQDLFEIQNNILNFIEIEITRGNIPSEFTYFDQWKDYSHFYTNYIYTYCFDQNYDVKIEVDKIICYPIDKEKRRRWTVNGEKQKKWKEIYEQVAHCNTKSNDDKSYYSGNFNLEPIEAANELFMLKYNETYAIAASYFGIKINENKVYKNFAQFMFFHQITSFSCFVNFLDMLYSRNPSTWLEKLKKFLDKTNQSLINKISLDELRNTIDKEGISDDEFKNIVNILSADVNSKRPSFVIDLYSTPFLRIGNSLYSIMSALGSNDISISITNSILNAPQKITGNYQKDETDMMEEKLKELFIENGFHNVIRIDEATRNKYKIKGDSDVIVYENGRLMLIQLKRTRISDTLDEYYLESKNSFDKAAKQLSDFEEFISNNFSWIKDLLSIKEKSFEDVIVYPLIVSTSFEFDHEYFKSKYKKISLFELEYILSEMNFESCRKENINSLDAIKRSIDNEDVWEEINDSVSVPEDDSVYNIIIPFK